MDAVVGMDGDGPSGGRTKDIGVVLASNHVHALDAVALRLVGAKPESVWTISAAIDRGLLPKDLSTGIETLGDSPADLHVEDFRMPPKQGRFGGIPNALGTFAAEGASRKPVFSKQRCTGCGKCVEICPAGVLLLQKNLLPKVRIRVEDCIRCYCCHEVCPENAIDLRRMPLRSWGRAIGRRLKGWRSRQKRVRSNGKE
jgi:ferredoxin